MGLILILCPKDALGLMSILKSHAMAYSLVRFYLGENTVCHRGRKIIYRGQCRYFPKRIEAKVPITSSEFSGCDESS